LIRSQDRHSGRHTTRNEDIRYRRWVLSTPLARPRRWVRSVRYLFETWKDQSFRYGNGNGEEMSDLVSRGTIIQGRRTLTMTLDDHIHMRGFAKSDRDLPCQCAGLTRSPFITSHILVTVDMAITPKKPDAKEVKASRISSRLWLMSRVQISARSQWLMVRLSWLTRSNDSPSRL
jgi:hypothetical protein